MRNGRLRESERSGEPTANHKLVGILASLETHSLNVGHEMMKKNVTVALVLTAIIAAGVLWAPVAQYLRLSSGHSQETLVMFEKRMNQVTNGMARADVVQIAGTPRTTRETRTGEQIVYFWKGRPTFAIDPNKIRQKVCQYAFNICEGRVESYSRSPAKGVPNKPSPPYQ